MTVNLNNHSIKFLVGSDKDVGIKFVHTQLNALFRQIGMII